MLLALPDVLSSGEDHSAYEEARRLLRIDDMLERIEAAIAAGKANPGEERFHHRRVDILRGCARQAVAYLEELWPSSRGSHPKLLARLQSAQAE